MPGTRNPGFEHQLRLAHLHQLYEISAAGIHPSKVTALRKVSPLALLRPLAGRRLPRELEAERVAVTAAQIPGGVRDAEFRVLLSKIESGPFQSSARVDVYLRGDQAFEAIRKAIRGARREVLLESYILNDDEAGREMLKLLGDACNRGVKVRVLADDVGSWTTRKEYWKAMRACGVEVRFFHRIADRWWLFLHRDHRKILVVDRRIGLLGGMNIADEYTHSVPDDKQHGARSNGLWRDTHARVEGPPAWGMALVFEEGWTRAGGVSPKVPNEMPRDLLPGPNTMLLDSFPGRGQTESAAALAAVIGAARERVWITNSYFCPPHFALKIFRDAVKRGVDVRLLLPGPTDVPLVRHAGHGFFGGLLRDGVKIYEYQPSVLHAKTVVADGYASLLGSSNLDFRSFWFNAECNLLVLDDCVGETLSNGFEDDLRRSKEITLDKWKQRPFKHRVADGVARKLRRFL